jgi:hypothetical protein
MTRQALVVVMLLSASMSAAAQPASPTQPSIGLPLPPIGLPLPAIGLSTPRDIFEPPVPSTPPPDGPPVPSRPTIVLFGVAPYAWGLEPWQRSQMPGTIAQPPSYPTPDVPETGKLQLEVTPRDAQIYVDGEFVGTWIDLQGELELTPGTHRIELRAPKHDALSFDVRIVAGRTITYRGALDSLEERRDTSRPRVPPAADPRDVEPAPAAPPKVKPQTFYLIPGCYLGNIPPEQVKLPDGCDLKRLITHTPK